MRRGITHYEHGGTAACTARIRAPWLAGDTRLVDCKSCERTGHYQRAVPAALPGYAHPADVAVLTEWAGRLAG
jgi:hypothetical protein